MGPDWMVRGHSFAQETRCSGVGKGHVEADFGDDRVRGALADARDLIESLDDAWRAVGHCGGIDPGRIAVAGVRIAAAGVRIGIDARTRARAGVAVIDGPSRVGQLGDQLLDARGQGVDLGEKRIDLAQQHPRQLGVMIIEAAVERGDQLRAFGLHLPACQRG